MHIRPAMVDDVEKLFEIRCSVRENHMTREEMAALGITPESVQDMIGGGHYSVPVAVADGEAVGFAMAHIAECSVFALFVAPAHEGQGIGAKLLAHVEEALRQNGVRQAWLATDADERVRAVGFYRHHGWRDAGFMEDGQLRLCKQLFTAS